MYRRVFVTRPALCAVALAGAIGLAGQAQATVLLADDFGFAATSGPPFDALGFGRRLDAAGVLIPVGLGVGGSQLNGLRAETPSNANEVWATGTGGRKSKVVTWQFAVSNDPLETNLSPADQASHGVMFLRVNPANNDVAPPGETDALLPFTAPTGAFQESMDFLSQTSLPAGHLFAIGFTSSIDHAHLYDNFATFGQASLTIQNDVARGGTVDWTLRTNGTAGPSVSGSVVIGLWNQMALSYDPATHRVLAGIDGVTVGGVDYTPTNIAGAGFEGSGIADNFIVQTGALQAPVLSAAPEPASWALMILGFGGVGALVRRRRAVLA